MSDVLADIKKKIAREKNIASGAANLKKKTENPSVIQKCNASIREAYQNIEYLESTLAKLSLDDPGKPTSSETQRTNPVYSRLDLLKYDGPSLGHRIQYMLQQLQFKIQVEQQYLEANEKISKLYQLDGDRQSTAAAEGGRVESDQKIHLLKKALKRNQELHVDNDEVSRDTDILNMPEFRKKPLSGTLQIKVSSVRDVDHFVSKKLETVFVVKVDDAVKVRSKPSKSDRWNEEYSVDVEKGNEVEVTLYDRSNGHMVPVAVTWFLLSDIAEEIRKKKVNQERGNTGWISASKIQAESSSSGDETKFEAPLPAESSEVGGLSTSAPVGSAPVASSSWYVLEPAGQILVTLSFTKSDSSKGTDFIGGLGRHGAIRQRKEEVFEQHGHKFVQKQFYNIMCCALCGDFLRYTGFQCQDCKFLCHKKCYQKVVTKCISKASTDVDPDEMKLNHRIPHRFEPVSNRGTKWCCHCGYILPWSRKTTRKCSECGIFCHQQCTHLVPDFCGMSMETANEILSAIKMTQKPRPKQESVAAKNKKELPPIPRQAAPLDKSFVSEVPTYDQGQIPTQTNKTKQRPMRRPPPDAYQVHRPKSSSYYEPQPNEPQPIPSLPQSISQQSISQQSIAQQPIQPVAPTAQPIPPAPEESKKKHHRRKIGLDDFQFLAVLGKGNFGKVMLAESRHTNQLCAIKVLKKDFILENEEVESTRSEKRVFLIANRERHPFLLNLHCCFQTENRIYFVMEYISGGDLMWHIQKQRFSQRLAQFYAAEVLLALRYFHENGVIYRDLKLDNILLATNGHIKIADYGLCKEDMWHGNTTSTFCGTPEFMAPEILMEKQYGKAVDWWAFGVLLYQMLLGQSPFRGDDEDEVFNAILTDEPLYPIQMGRESVDILQKLLTRDPEKRLGASATDAKEIMQHPYFRNIDWDDILNLRVQPPYMPEVKSSHDVSNFDDEFTSETPRLTPINTLLSSSMQEQFRGFSHISDEVV